MNFVSEFQLLEAAVLRDLEAMEDHDRSAFAGVAAYSGDSILTKISNLLRKLWGNGIGSNARAFGSRSGQRSGFDTLPRRFKAEVIPISIRPARKH
jgi:hypothetical protein